MPSNQPVKPAMFILLAQLLFYGVHHALCLTVPSNETEKLALLDFKEAIRNDPYGALRSWDTATPYCQWNGVSCSHKHPGRVRKLDLCGHRLSGSISASLGNLTFLKILNLSKNHLSGELPSLHNLQKLQYLILAENLLQGIIPNTLTNCSSLEHLDLSGNFLKGEIPIDVGLLRNLVELTLSQNNLTGLIPPSLKNITQPLLLNLAENQLTGSIPDELGQLLALDLGINMLSGGIPSVLFNMSSIRYLDVSLNALSMELPSYFGDNLPHLAWLSLYHNMFEGHIPPSLGNASLLVSIDLSYNNFTGQVPSSFGKLRSLYSLNLEKNKLEARDSRSWEFVDTLSQCINLDTLNLHANNLQGAMPDTFGNLSAITQLVLGANNLSGTIPISIGNLDGLVTFKLANNNLNGSIEEWIGKLHNLQDLALDDNNLIGSIPSSIGDLSGLRSLSLAKNKFEGHIPPSLGNLPLSMLNLSYNNLRGSIPKEMFRSGSTMINCGLSYNNLEGPIPPEIGNLQQLNELQLSSNKLTGEIPDTLGGCEGLLVIQMDHNFLTGNISRSLGNLKSLTVLNLSHNNFSGFIPSELSRLQYLTQLDLSYNYLQGKIPTNGVFGNAESVSLLGNQGLCGGLPDLHMPSCPTISRGRERQYYLIKILIPIFGVMSLMVLAYFLITEVKMARRRSYSSSPPFGEKFLKVSYNDLAEATKNFSESNLIGRGSYGSVYKGQLMEDKQEVAVKVLDLDMQGAEKSFLSECEALRSIQHRNLVPIITACSTVDIRGNLFKALIYEFMPNGNLDTWLHPRDRKDSKRLDLTQRINIAINIADALDYLHNDSGRPIIHCDVKPSNILLDDDMNAHLGDFGIASFYLHPSLTTIGSSNTTTSVGVKGTIGYIAPEYAGGARVSTCGDVYSFGTLLLEMLTGKRPTDPMFENGLNIVNFVERNFPDQILLVIDAKLQDECKLINQENTMAENNVCRCLLSLLEVALSCTRQFPNERMNMREADNRLHAIKASTSQKIVDSLK